MKILFFDDYHFLYQTIQRISKEYAFIIDFVKDKRNAQLKIKLNNYDLVIVNIHADYEQALEFILEEKQKNPDLLIIAIAQNIDEDKKLELLKYYVDDIFLKPFNWHELMIKAQKIYTRSNHLEIQIQHWHNYGPLKINPQKQTISVYDKEIQLRYKEFLIFNYLLEHPNQVISKEELLEKVWDENVDLFSNSINVHIYNLRKKIKKILNIDIIETIRGRGILLNLEYLQ